MTDDTPQTAPAGEPAAAPGYDAQAALAVAEQELTVLRAELDAARKEAAEATLRAQAELQNVRKRLERDADNSRKYILEKFAGELLAVVDSLDRGLGSLNAGEEALKPAREGMDLTLKLLKDTLRKFEIEEIDPKGQAFNPQLHEAVAQIPNAEVAANTVIDVMQKGFSLSGRLLRPAMVVVSRNP
jgi:molecular chaperone GrpE